MAYNKLFVRLLDPNSDLIKVFDNNCMVQWEYKRRGGCGQSSVIVKKPFDFLDDKVEPKSSLQISINDELRYHGRIITVNKIFGKGKEEIQLNFYGYLSELSRILIKRTFIGQSASGIVKTILDDEIVPNTEVTYDSADIEESEASIANLVLNHTTKDAMNLLAELAGNFEWGVDRHKKFFFKKSDTVIRRVFVIGQDIENYKSQRKDEDVINVLSVFGVDGTTPIVTVESELSIAKFGRSEANRFESSISEASDANRLAIVTLKNTTTASRTVQFALRKDDLFIESSTPLGATAISKNVLNQKSLYNSGEYKSDSYTKLLLHCNGVDESIDFIDDGDTGHTVTAEDNAQLDTAQRKFGSASGLFDGVGAHLTIPDSDDWSFGVDNFTVDCWVRFNSLDGIQYLLMQWEDDNNYWLINKSSLHALSMSFISGGVNKGNYTVQSGQIDLEINKWYHVAFERIGVSAKIFINGISYTLVETAAFSTNDVGNVNGILYIGKPGIANYYLNGWIDEFRITKGIARWTSNFDVPAGLHKYGKNIKYGNLKRDQINTIRYSISGGGLKTNIQLIKEIPNLGDQQSFIENQIKNLQRR